MGLVWGLLALNAMASDVNKLAGQSPWVVNSQGEKVYSFDDQGNRKVAIGDSTGNGVILEDNGSVPVTLQDQTTRSFNYPFLLVEKDDVVCTSGTTVGEREATFSTSHGIDAGDIVAMFTTDGHFYYGTALSVVTDTVTFDALFDHNFSSGTTCAVGTRNMNVDGSSTPKFFKACIGYDVSGCTKQFDIVQLSLSITDQTDMDDAKFGGLSALTRGVMFRVLNGHYSNEWSIPLKTNGDMARVLTVINYSDKAPSGYYGLTGRLVYGGQDNYGVVRRIGNGVYAEIVIQDDLTGLDTFFVNAVGSEVNP